MPAGLLEALAICLGAVVLGLLLSCIKRPSNKLPDIRFTFAPTVFIDYCGPNHKTTWTTIDPKQRYIYLMIPGPAVGAISGTSRKQSLYDY